MRENVRVRGLLPVAPPESGHAEWEEIPAWSRFPPGF